MEGYNHFIRIDSNSVIIDGYADWQNDKRSSDEIMLTGLYGRAFTIQLLNDRLQYKYKLVNGSITLRTQEELDEEWNARPEPAPTLEQQISDLQDVINVLLMGGI